MEIPGYEIEKLIGKGGMASVYLALHKALNRKVAIKVMNRQQGTDSDFSDRFLREAHIVANLSHPNIITIHDVGEHDGHNYLVMEFLPSGETLCDKIKEGVDAQYALSIVRQVATALNVAHEQNIVHRDIKPDNIMFRADGSVVLMDFGVARSVDTAATQMTQAGLIVGTPKYISPEQGQGENVGACSDIYSLGVVFYEMLTGEAPYTADTPLSLVYKHVSAPVPDLTGDLAIYQPLLDRMMAKAREERYSTCNHIIADIDSIREGKPAVHAAEILSTTAVDIGNATAENLDNDGADFPSVEATENLNIDAVNKGDATVENLNSTGVRNSENDATEILSRDEVEKSIAAAENLTIIGDISKDKGKDKVATQAEKKKTYPVGRSSESRKKSKSLLWITMGLLIAGGIFIFVDVDIRKLKTLVGLDVDMGELKALAGLDAGPVYSRVGRLISIPEGSFKMGNASGDSTENPVHSVHINGFRLGETEVTQKQWQLVMGSNTSYFKGCDNCPVDGVNWNDVQDFLKKLKRQTGLRFRLPSEAEWEYACRSAGKDEKYCGGDDAGKLAWYGNNSGDKTHSVAQKQANGLGLYDMSGNVREWTKDCWHDSYRGAPSYGQAWGRGNCAQRVLRGGSWIDVASGLSSTGRIESSAAKGGRNLGFRVAQDLN